MVFDILGLRPYKMETGGLESERGRERKMRERHLKMAKLLTLKMK